MKVALHLPPPARMGILVAAKYCRAGYAIRRAIWNGAVTLQNPTPTTGEIAAAHALAWVTYARGLFSYSEPATPVARRVVIDADALLSDYEAADWTTLAPEKDNDDLFYPPPPDPPEVDTSSAGTSGSGGGGGGSSGSGGGGGGGAGTGKSNHDCGKGFTWDGTKCVRNKSAASQPTITLTVANLTSDECTLTDPTTNTFGATAKVNDWGGAKAGDVWFISYTWTPDGMVPGARGAKAVGEELADSKAYTANLGQTFTLFVTAWLPGSGGLTVTAKKTFSMQALCACVSSSAQIQVVLSGVTLRPCSGGGVETHLITALDGTYTLTWTGSAWAYAFTVYYQNYTAGCVPSGAPFAVDATLSVTCVDGAYSITLAGTGYGPYFQGTSSSGVPLSLVCASALNEAYGADAYDGTATLTSVP